MPFKIDVYDPLPVQKLPARAKAADVLNDKFARTHDTRESYHSH